MKRLLVVLLGMLVFQGSVWAAKCDEMTAKVLSPGANSVLIKDLPFVLQWQDDDLCLGRRVTIDLVDATGTGSRIAYRKNKKDYKVKHPNSGFLNIDRLIAPVSDHKYRFKISPAKKAQGQESIESEPIVVRRTKTCQKKDEPLGCRSYASIPYQIGDLLTRFAALEERLAELTGVGGEQELTHTQVEIANVIQIQTLTVQWNELKEELAVMKQNILSNSDLVRQTRQEGQPGQAIVQGSPSEQTPQHQLEELRDAQYKREAQEFNRARAEYKRTVWDTDESGRLPPGTAWEALTPTERTRHQYDACWYSSGVEDTDKSAGIWVVAPPGNILCGAWGNEATCREEMRLWATLQCCASVSGSCEQPSIGPRCKNILARGGEGKAREKQRYEWTDQQMIMVDCFGDGEIHGPKGSFRPPNIHGSTCGIQYDINLEPPKC